MELEMHPTVRDKIVLAASVLIAASCVLSCAQTRVQTTAGTIEGSAENGIVSFKGIPFAAPPVGDLRWRAPQPPASWQGVRKATEFGASCIQPIVESMLPMHMPWTEEFLTHGKTSENCLFLNIWSPKVGPNTGLPVVVFIHGGGFNSGSGDVALYDGTNLAAKDLVVVTINYRLSVFGFLAHPELTAESDHHSSGSYGILDQIAALKWVNENIANFGGNPHDVTIWGQSAGTFSVGALVASPLTANLFQRGQADSGLGFSGLPMMKLGDAENAGVKFAESRKAATIKELRSMPAEALMQSPMTRGMGFSPIVDGWVLPDNPNSMSEKGTDNDVPIITGYQAGDSSMFAFGGPSTLEAYHETIKKQYGEMAAEFEKLYPAIKVEDIKSVTAQSGQERGRVSMFLWASTRAKSHHSPVYTYFFDRAIPWPQHPEFGAFHTGEIPYFFLNLKMLDRPWEQVDFTLAKGVSSYLVNFATKGDPNGAGLTQWPKIDPKVPQTIELGSHIGPMPVANKEKMDFWMRYFASPISNNGSPF
jgi:para-nitrobenzyl esterase